MRIRPMLLLPCCALAVLSRAPAEPMVCVGCPPRPPMTLDQRLAVSFSLSGFVATGSLRAPVSVRRIRPATEGRALAPFRFEVGEVVAGIPTTRVLEVVLPTYEAREQSWLEALLDRDPLERLSLEMRRLEREQAAGRLDAASYAERRAQLRAKILRSPGYRKGGHVLVRIAPRLDSESSPYRDADVLVELGRPILLMAAGDPALWTRRTLSDWNLDLHPESRLSRLEALGLRARAHDPPPEGTRSQAHPEETLDEEIEAKLAAAIAAWGAPIASRVERVDRVERFTVVWRVGRGRRMSIGYVPRKARRGRVEAAPLAEQRSIVTRVFRDAGDAGATQVEANGLDLDEERVAVAVLVALDRERRLLEALEAAGRAAEPTRAP